MLVIPCFILHNCLIFICLMVAKLKCSQYLIFICFIKQAITAACSASCLNLIISQKKTLRFYVKIAKVQSQFIIGFIFFDECSKHSVSSTVKKLCHKQFCQQSLLIIFDIFISKLLKFRKELITVNKPVRFNASSPKGFPFLCESLLFNIRNHGDLVRQKSLFKVQELIICL